MINRRIQLLGLSGFMLTLTGCDTVTKFVVETLDNMEIQQILPALGAAALAWLAGGGS